MVWYLTALMGFGVVVLLGLSSVVWYSLHPVRLAPNTSPKDKGLAYESVVFPSRDGTPLSGWWIPANSAKATLILCHGYKSSRWEFLPLLTGFHKAGYNVLAFDFRRLGESGGDMSTIGLREPRDLLGAVDYAAGRTGGPIAALGKSMGASVCLMAASQDPRIGAIIADSAYCSLDVAARRRFGPQPVGPVCGKYACWLGERILHEHLSDASPLRAAAQLSATPVLLIHSVNDHVIPFGDSEAILAAYAGPKELWLAESSEHAGTDHEMKAQYLRRSIAFIDGWLAKRPAVHHASSAFRGSG